MWSQKQQEKLIKENKALKERIKTLEHNHENIVKGAIGNLGHHINTPLNAILGYLQILSAEHHEFLAQESEVIKGLNTIEKHCEALHKTSRLFLMLTNEFIANNQIQTFSLNELRTTAWLQAIEKQCDAEEIDFTCEYEENMKVKCVKSQLFSIIQYLINNAMVHTKSQKRKISLTIHQEKEKDELIITVKDNGPGMDPEIAEKLIGEFMTGEQGNARTNQNALGLGLSITTHIVKAMGGKIEFIKSKGLTVITTLPILTNT